jgi:hypothetical protein
VTYPVDVLDEVRLEDIPVLPDDEVRLAAAHILRELHFDPRLGTPLRDRFNLAVLRGCRRIPFDKAGWRGKPRFRFVFRNEPDDGAVARTTVLAIAAREDLTAYRKAAARRRRPAT